ncbi:condensin-2 complex subunit H2 [Malania oleifera]|uniref:condensin-2 complex subunit H2 n=1 Tax=Malania oleifera TaxID=397392 RepID=UPI0025ADDA24|nr:condensin-2 complex subunit H2 [Malania oleifera]
MSAGREEPSGEGSGGRIHTVQPLRDLESNWAVDLAKNLEEYLLKICSGEITGEDGSRLSVNFAEAALLLQGSIQVYSRKVEYLYSLVLHALDFISQKRQEDQPAGTSTQPEESVSHVVHDEENDIFWGLDDVPVEEKNCLDISTGKDASSNHFVKPPANLVVLEGDCLDTTGEGGELESYLLATNDLYQDFILLDPCDAVSVQEFLKGDKAGNGHSGAYRNNSLNSKSRKSFLSPTRRSGGTAHKSSLGRNQNVSLNRTPLVDRNFEVNDHNIRADPAGCDFFENDNCGFNMDSGYFESRDSEDSEDDEDPWKPLNPHESGNLKVKPFKKVKAFQRHEHSAKLNPLSAEFPLAKLHGPISSEFMEIWERQCHAHERQQDPGSLPLYEKLRQSLVDGGYETRDTFCNFGVDDEDDENDGGIPDFGHPNVGEPESMQVDEEAPLNNNKHDDDPIHFDFDDAYGHEDPNSHRSLEDLCRAHLDALLASIAETEKETALAARVSTWKHKIEHNLEEQDSHPPFDIHEYGEKILDKLALEVDNRNAVSFSDIVSGREKHDVARTFSALLQLVNNGSVALDKSGANGESICFTAVNPFYVQLLSHDKKRGEIRLPPSKKRAKSPIGKGYIKGDSKSGRGKFLAVGSSSGFVTAMSSQPNCKFSLKLGKAGSVMRCTPEGKRRRRSRLVEPVDLHSAG